MRLEKIYKVFVSSTYEDLREERAAVQKGLLQLGCLPVGMELFPAADDETWSFIKSQIDDSDYYVVVVAGRYGSQGTDGVSFTEMEYDYALTKNKPAIGFVHADPGSIAASKTETSEDARAKLREFVDKIKKRPVREFKNPHELALEVTTSFVQLIRNRPAIGYVRTDESVDFRRYSELLEENNKLKEALSVAQQPSEITPFPAHENLIQLTILKRFRPETARSINCTLSKGFQAVAEGVLLHDDEVDVFDYAARFLFNAESDELERFAFDELSMATLRRKFLLYGLLEVGWEDRSGYNMASRTTATQTIRVWRLTDYGRRQLAAIAP